MSSSNNPYRRPTYSKSRQAGGKRTGPGRKSLALKRETEEESLKQRPVQQENDTIWDTDAPNRELKKKEEDIRRQHEVQSRHEAALEVLRGLTLEVEEAADDNDADNDDGEFLGAARSMMYSISSNYCPLENSVLFVYRLQANNSRHF